MNRVTRVKNAGHNFLLAQINGDMLGLAAGALLAMPAEAFDRYDNPFEQKWTLRDKTDLPYSLATLAAYLEADLRLRAQDYYGVPLLRDDTRHYLGFFKYDPGDYLDVHVDAGLHPLNGLRKRVTTCLYLGEGMGDFELWEGDDCTDDAPRLTQLVGGIAPRHGQIIIFENNDHAWHGAGVNNSSEPRLLITASYMMTHWDTAKENDNNFRNARSRAYFVPRPHEEWSPERCALRDKRADPERYAEAYRAAL